MADAAATPPAFQKQINNEIGARRWCGAHEGL
jgi:hypothetical protein